MLLFCRTKPQTARPSKVGWALAAHAFLSPNPISGCLKQPFHRVGINAPPTPKQSSLNAIIPFSGCLPSRIHPSQVGWALAAHAFLSPTLFQAA